MRSLLRLDLAKAAGVEIANSFGDFGFTVHHKRAIAHDGFIQRLAGHQQHFGIAAGFADAAVSPLLT